MIAVRPMLRRDVRRVHEIEVQSFPTPWSLASLMGETHNRLAHYYVVEVDGRIEGYGGMWVLFEEAHITNIAIAPNSRGRHLGKYLLYAMMDRAHFYGADKMTLEVRETNEVAQNLYYSMDFQKEGFRRRYYEDTGEGAYLLWNQDIFATLAKNACLKADFSLQ